MRPHRHVIWGVMLIWAFLIWNPGAVFAESIHLSFGKYPKFNDAMANGTTFNHVEKNKNPKYRLNRFVLEGESAFEWTEALEVLNTRRKDAPKKVEKWYQRFRDHGELSCPSEWRVLAQESKSITFERISGKCPSFEAQHALYRVLYGKRNVFVLIATVVGTMGESTREQWLAVMESAKVCKGNKDCR